jgi:hypothetical protein
VILILGRIDLKSNVIEIIKGLIHQEDKALINIHAPTSGAYKYIMKVLKTV